MRHEYIVNMGTLVWVAPEHRYVRTGECVEWPTDQRRVPWVINCYVICTLMMRGEQVRIATRSVSESTMTV